MKISVIFTTYNSPEWLEKVLWGYYAQTFRDFEVLIADDGSGEETRNLIKNMQREMNYPVTHVWHEDAGFRKCEILNKAIAASHSDYLVFSDGDCIPRNDFLQVHYENRKQGYFLSGGAVRLPMELSRHIQKQDILEQKCFQKDWLLKNGLKRNLIKNLKLTYKKSFAGFLNRISPTNASWNGNNSSTWKKDILDINGYDERMQYGGLDREFGERLMNKKIRSILVRYSAVCIHLDHSRGYKNEESIRKNRMIRSQTRKNKIIRTPFGITKSKQNISQ